MDSGRNRTMVDSLEWFMKPEMLGSCDAALTNLRMNGELLPIFDTQRRLGSTGSISDESEHRCDISLAEIDDVLNDATYTEFDPDKFDSELEKISMHQLPEESTYSSFMTAGQYGTSLISNHCTMSGCTLHCSRSNCALCDRLDNLPYSNVTNPPPSPTNYPLSPAISTTSEDSYSSTTANKSRKDKTSKKTASVKSTLPKFMWQTINNERYNPTHIKWLNQKEGIFLIVKPKAIAELWGEQKGNPKMKYPSMSRGIRERRKYGYFDRVPQDPRYPKKLTYKFGPMVVDYLK